MKKFILFSILTFLFSILHGKIQDTPVYYKIDLKKEVGSTSWIYVQNGLQEALKAGAKAIILHMNTYGGTVLHADSIRTALLNCDIPVYAFIDNNAASAGALIAIACDSIYMRKGANIGAATVVNQTGEAMPDKYQSYMRATIRSTAEAHGADTTITAQGDTLIKWRRNPLIAEAMVDERVVIPNVIDSGKVLTLTALEAQKLGYCEGICENTDQIIRERLGETHYELQTYKPSLYDDLKGLLTNPALQAILVMIIIAGIYFEMQSPGIGFPSIAALIAAVLYFAPLYLDGLASNWEILVFVIGVILFLIEIFIIPGFGFAGISGILLIIAGLLLALINNVNFDFSPVGEREVTRSILTVVAGIACGFGIIIFLSHKIGKGMFFNRLALKTSQDAVTEEAIETRKLVGETGTTLTDMRPAGKVKIGTELYDGIALHGFIERDTQVTVVKSENNQLYVNKTKS